MLGFVLDDNIILTNLPCSNSNYDLMVLKKAMSASNGEIQTINGIPQRANLRAESLEFKTFRLSRLQ